MVGDLCGSVCAYGRACIIAWPSNRTVRRGARLRHWRPAIGDADSSPVACDILLRAAYAANSSTVSATAPTRLVSTQIVPGIDVSDLSTPTTAGCLQPARLRLRVRGGAHPR